jgi:hypothetical protein
MFRSLSPVSPRQHSCRRDPDSKRTAAELHSRRCRKRENVGFFAGIKKKIAGWFATIGGLTAVTSTNSSSTTSASRPPAWVIKYAIEAIVAAFVLWFLYQGAMHLWRKIASAG